jgi:hypothetical protein
MAKQIQKKNNFIDVDPGVNKVNGENLRPVFQSSGLMPY